MKKIVKEVIPYIIIVILVVLIRTYIATPVIVSGDSMTPTLEDKQILLLNKLNYKTGDIKRFDIVVIKIDKKEIIKRVIGLPGEMVEYRNNTLYIDGHDIKNEYNFDTEEWNKINSQFVLFGRYVCKSIKPECEICNLKSICNCDKIPQDKYLVLGDNREVSADSRIIGLIDRENIEGNVNISIWPIKKVS